MFVADNWKEYKLIDASDGERLEQWGKYVLIRPDPQIIWHGSKKSALWKKADGTAILAVGSWSDKPETVHLILPEPFSGRDLNQPEIPGFQTAGSYPAETAFEISPKQGMLFIIK